MAPISSRQLAALFNFGPQNSVRVRRGRAMAAAIPVLLSALLLAARFAGAQALSPGGPVDFGSTPVGNTSTSITLTFTANTTTTVTAIAAVTDGALNQDFTVVSQSCLGPLAPPASCLVTLNFKPSQIGLRRGELLITDGTGSYANRVPLHGVGLAAQVVFQPAVAKALTSVPSLSPATIAPTAALYDGAGNLYVLDAGNNRLLEQTPSQTASGDFSVAATFSSLSTFSSLAIAGDGTLFISSPDTGVVYAIVPGGSPLPLATGVALQRPAGLATDGYGYLYISDNGASRLLRVALDGSGTAAFSLASLQTPLSGPAGLAIDTNRNLYIADSGNNRIVRVSLNTGAASAVRVSGLTLSAPMGLAVDAAGTLTVADTGNARLAVIETSGTAFTLPVSGATLSSPVAVLLQPNGDGLASDSTVGLFTLSRSATSLTFPTTTKVGSIDATDGELSFTLQNTGSYPLNASGAADPTLSTGAFSVAGDSTCPALPGTSTSVSPFSQSTTCTYAVTFKPTTKGANKATLGMAFSGVGGSGASSSIAPTAALSGTGYTVLASFSLTAAPASTTLGTPVSVTVTALNNDGSVDTGYTGTAVFSTNDLTATFPNSARTYTFTVQDAGVHTFPAMAGQGWAFNSVGGFTISARESLDPTIAGTSNLVQVVNNSAISLGSSVNPTLAGGATVLSATVTASVGTPTGTVTFLDGSSVLGTVALAGGQANLTLTLNTAGSHTLTASYGGDGSFLPATSAPITQLVEDFTLAIAPGGSAKATIVNRGSASYALLVSPVGGPGLAGAVTLSVSSLPAGFSGVFTPVQVNAGSAAAPVTLLVNGGRLALLDPRARPRAPWSHEVAPVSLALLLMPALFVRRRVTRAVRVFIVLALAGSVCTGFMGCFSDTAAGYYGTVPSTQTLTVTASSGSLTHTLSLSLTTE